MFTHYQSSAPQQSQALGSCGQTDSQHVSRCPTPRGAAAATYNRPYVVTPSSNSHSPIAPSPRLNSPDACLRTWHYPSGLSAIQAQIGALTPVRATSGSMQLPVSGRIASSIAAVAPVRRDQTDQPCAARDDIWKVMVATQENNVPLPKEVPMPNTILNDVFPLLEKLQDEFWPMLAKLQDDVKQLQRAQANEIVDLTAKWEQRITSLEHGLLSAQQAMHSGLHAATSAAASISERAEKFTQLGEAMERALSWVDQSDRRCVLVEQRLDALESDLERLAKFLIESGALPRNGFVRSSTDSTDVSNIAARPLHSDTGLALIGAYVSAKRDDKANYLASEVAALHKSLSTEPASGRSSLGSAQLQAQNSGGGVDLASIISAAGPANVGESRSWRLQ